MSEKRTLQRDVEERRPRKGEASRREERKRERDGGKLSRKGDTKRNEKEKIKK